MGVIFSDRQLRAMYRGGRANRTARWFARAWSTLCTLGLAPRRAVSLEVPGRRTGRPTRFPLVVADCGGERYLVAMLGERSNWVRNVRAAGGRVTLRRRRAVAARLEEVPVRERAPILRRYLELAPGARPHIPVDPGAPVDAFEAIAADYPVFRVTSAAASTTT